MSESYKFLPEELGNLSRENELNGAVSKSGLKENKANQPSTRMSPEEQLKQDWNKFASGICHDFAPIVRRLDSYADMLRDELNQTNPDRGEVMDFLTSIQVGARSLTERLVAVREYTRLSNMTPDIQLYDLSQLLSEFLDWFREQYPADVEWEIDLKEGEVYTDRYLLRYALSRMLENSVISTTLQAESKIRIGVFWLSSSEGQKYRIEIEDNGIGFSARQAESLFDFFSRAHLEREYPHKGVGAGLAYVAKIAQLLGGEVAAMGAPKGGSTFTLTLPKSFH